MGKGGKSYYAIDVTFPTAVIDETTAASQVLWEFKNADLGYTYGRPFITKTHAAGWGWVVIVASGYNNASGLGKIFFIDAATGSLLKTMSTGSGTPGSPSGLAHVAGYTKDYHNQLVEQIYGGDLYGHFWRFDVSDSDPNKWSVVELATLTDAGGAPQPVTTPPQIEVDLVNGVDRWVFVGHGRLLDDTDLTDPKIDDQQQTLYAIRDGTGVSPLPFLSNTAPENGSDSIRTRSPTKRRDSRPSRTRVGTMICHWDSASSLRSRRLTRSLPILVPRRRTIPA
jgi:type IV pilus assembly protein PilY1